MASEKIDGFTLEQRHGKARVRLGRVWRSQSGRHIFVEWTVSISLLPTASPPTSATTTRHRRHRFHEKHLVGCN
ncbi:Uricase-2 [Vitis vinifera]|uniref:Uricase-2 n=1 Tax=Vitis vinifera TaxID=29760 RepID=A0A438CSD7_VITVI|nr:Uricase-2 [Vitis vinifera]